MPTIPSLRANRYLLGLIPLGLGLAAAVPVPTLETSLLQVKAAAEVPADFQVVYNDMSGMYGGMTITIAGDGTAQMVEKGRGPAPAVETSHQATTDEMLALVDLLAELKAWEQLTPERMAVPDESRATLSLTVNTLQGGFWEWYNDLGQNDRLVKIQQQMKTIATP